MLVVIQLVATLILTTAISSNAAVIGSKPILKLTCPGYKEFYPDPEWPDYYQLFKPTALIKFYGKNIQIRSYLNEKYNGVTTSTRKNLTGNWQPISIDVKIPKNFKEKNYKVKYVVVDQYKRSNTYVCAYETDVSNSIDSVDNSKLTPNNNSLPKPLPIYPIGGKIYFGQSNSYQSECWFAKKFTNSTSSVSSAVAQRADVLNSDGTKLTTIIFEVPSLRPNSNQWVVSWLLNKYICEKGISRVVESDVKLMEFYDLGNTYTRSLTTSEVDIPTVIAVVESPGKYINSTIYKLRIKNNSLDKTLKSSNNSRINFVFLDVSETPVYATVGRIRYEVLPSSEAILEAWDFEINSITPIPGAVKVVGSLNFELCKQFSCTY